MKKNLLPLFATLFFSLFPVSFCVFGQTDKPTEMSQNASPSAEVPSPSPRMEEPFRPHEAWWCDVEPKELFFQKNGRILFTKSFTRYNPSKWEYLPKTREMKIIFPRKVAKEVRTFFAHQKRQREYEKQSSPRTFDPLTRELTFPFDESTESIELFGWFFYKSEN
jgi:hypothetical protein